MNNLNNIQNPTIQKSILTQITKKKTGAPTKTHVIRMENLLLDKLKEKEIEIEKQKDQQEMENFKKNFKNNEIQELEDCAYAIYIQKEKIKKEIKQLSNGKYCLNEPYWLAHIPSLKNDCKIEISQNTKHPPGQNPISYKKENGWNPIDFTIHTDTAKKIISFLEKFKTGLAPAADALPLIDEIENL